MNIRREWATPLTIGAFLLIAVTGMLLFFHVNNEAVEHVHEWFGWALIIGVVMHLIVNAGALKHYFKSRLALSIIGTFVAILILSFLPLGPSEKDEPRFAPLVHVLAQAPLETLAQIAHIPPEQIKERLSKQGIQASTEQQSIEDLVGPDVFKQTMVLKHLLDKNP